MQRFQVEVAVSASGYIKLEAPDAEAARKAVRALTASIHLTVNSVGKAEFVGGAELAFSLFGPEMDFSLLESPDIDTGAALPIDDENEAAAIEKDAGPTGDNMKAD
jgi:hypothetical protein